MLSRIIAVAFAATLLFSQPASALIYVTGLGGVNFLDETPITDPGSLFGNSSTMTTKLGYNFAGAVGMNAMGLRFEGELGFATNELDRLTSVPGSGTGTGFVSAMSYMGNVYYDFPVPILTPYVGIGIGLADIRMDGVATDQPFVVNDSKDRVFAWQVGAGVAMTMAPLTSLVVDYRYFSAADATLTDAFGNEFTFGYTRSMYRVGLRIGF